MPLFIMVTRLTGEEINPTFRLNEKESKVMLAIRDAGLEVEWVGNYAIMGPYDYIDIFHAPDAETAMKVGIMVRGMGHAHTEIWSAVEWNRFREMLTELPVYPPLLGRGSHAAA